MALVRRLCGVHAAAAGTRALGVGFVRAFGIPVVGGPAAPCAAAPPGRGERRAGAWPGAHRTGGGGHAGDAGATAGRGGEGRARAYASMPETALIERYRSLGRALDPYKRPPPPQNIASWFTGDGWRERSKRLTNTFQNGNTIVHLWRKLPGFGIGAFKAEALGIYCSVHRAMAEGDVKSVQDLLTDNMLISLQNETAQRLKRGVPPLIWRTDFEAQGVDVATPRSEIVLLFEVEAEK